MDLGQIRRDWTLVSLSSWPRGLGMDDDVMEMLPEVTSIVTIVPLSHVGVLVGSAMRSLKTSIISNKT